ncbi:hypothetical protein ACE6H2_003328 [Prunus campanulata]
MGKGKMRLGVGGAPAEATASMAMTDEHGLWGRPKGPTGSHLLTHTRSPGHQPYEKKSTLTERSQHQLHTRTCSNNPSPNPPVRYLTVFPFFPFCPFPLLQFTSKCHQTSTTTATTRSEPKL